MEYDSDVILLATPVGVFMEYMLPNTEWKANEARSPEFTGMQNTKRFTKLKKMIGKTRLSNKKFGFLLNVKWKISCIFCSKGYASTKS
jgi:hypothetical protein